MWSWIHNTEERQWELRVPQGRSYILIAYVTDEFIERAADLQVPAMRLFNKVGSLPPPLAKYLPPPNLNESLYKG